jgi:hypothetical protein
MGVNQEVAARITSWRRSSHISRTAYTPKITPHRRWTTLQRADDGSTDVGPLVITTDDRGLF